MYPPLQGLNQAFGRYMDDDPIGLGVRQRSMQSAQEGLDIPFGADPFGIQHSDALRNSINSMSDPQRFNDLMQTIKERVPGGIQTPSKRGDPLPGLPAAPFSNLR